MTAFDPAKNTSVSHVEHKGQDGQVQEVSDENLLAQMTLTCAGNGMPVHR